METTSEVLEYTAGSETPMVSDVRQANQVPVIRKRVPQSQKSRTSVAWNKSSGPESDGENSSSISSVPPSPATPPSLAWDSGYSSGDSTYEGVSNFPYNPRYVRDRLDAVVT